MNEYEVEDFAREARTPAEQVASVALQSLVNWANSNSDGWAYWGKPVNAAERLQALIQGDGTNRARESRAQRMTPEAVRKALVPIKAFRTRCERKGMPTFYLPSA